MEADTIFTMHKWTEDEKLCCFLINSGRWMAYDIDFDTAVHEKLGINHKAFMPEELWAVLGFCRVQFCLKKYKLENTCSKNVFHMDGTTRIWKYFNARDRNVYQL